MVLADTSIWIDHLRAENAGLAELLDSNEILMHPMVIGELACGNLANRRAILETLIELPAIRTVEYGEVLDFIEQHRLMGRGVDYVDVHLLAAVAMADSTLLWTRDRRLMDAAVGLNLAWLS